MSILDDIESDSPPTNRSHMDWLEKLILTHPQWVAEFRTLVKGWHAGTHGQKFRTKNALAKYVASHKDTPVRIGVQTISQSIEEMRP